MKKITSLILVCLLLACLPWVTAFAGDTVVTVSDVTLADDGTATAEVSIKGNTGFVACELDIYYDTNVLELKTIDVSGCILNGAVTNIHQDTSENIIYGIVAYASATSNTSDGTLCKLIFNVINKDAAADTVLSVSVKGLVDASGVKLMENTIVRNKDYVYNSTDNIYTLGDVDGDGSVSVKDVRSLFQYVNKQLDDSDVVVGAMDVDLNGTVNAMDVRYLFQYVNRQSDD